MGSHVTINNSGTVLMHVRRSTPEFNGLVTGPDTVADRVIAVGDSLFGSKVASVESDSLLAGHAINDKGQVVFSYTLTSGDSGLAIATPVDVISGAGQLVTGNAASFSATNPVAQDSLVTTLGTNLATDTLSATGTLPLSLLGTSVTVTDAAGVARQAPLLFVSPSQINYVLPQGTVVGAATVKVASGAGTTIAGTVNVAAVAPAVFALNSAGLVAANVLRVRKGVQTYETIYQVSGTAVVPLPLDLGPEGDQIYLILYGTGLRHAAKPQVFVAEYPVPVLYYAGDGDYPGLDQINIGPIPRAAAGSTLTSVDLITDGISSNSTSIYIK